MEPVIQYRPREYPALEAAVLAALEEGAARVVLDLDAVGVLDTERCGWREPRRPSGLLQSPKVYLVPSDRLYGKTKGGLILKLVAARARRGLSASSAPFKRST